MVLYINNNFDHGVIIDSIDQNYIPTSNNVKEIFIQVHIGENTKEDLEYLNSIIEEGQDNVIDELMVRKGPGETEVIYQFTLEEGTITTLRDTYEESMSGRSLLIVISFKNLIHNS